MEKPSKMRQKPVITVLNNDCKWVNGFKGLYSINEKRDRKHYFLSNRVG